MAYEQRLIATRKRAADGEEVLLPGLQKRVKELPAFVDPQDESFTELRRHDVGSEIPENLQQLLSGIYVATEGNQAFKWHSMNPLQVQAGFRIVEGSNPVDVCVTAPRLASPRYAPQHRRCVVDLWDLSNNTLIKTFGMVPRFSKIKLNSVATALAVTDGKTLCVWDILSETKCWSIDLEVPKERYDNFVRDLDFIPSNNILVVTSGTFHMGRTLFVDTTNGNILERIESSNDAIRRPLHHAVDSSSALMAIFYRSDDMAFHNLEVAPISSSLVFERRVATLLRNVYLRSMSFAAHDKLLLNCGEVFILWNFETETVISRIRVSKHSFDPSCAAFNATSNIWLCFGNYGDRPMQTLTIFDANTRKRVGEIQFTSAIQGVYCQQATTILL